MARRSLAVSSVARARRRAWRRSGGLGERHRTGGGGSRLGGQLTEDAAAVLVELVVGRLAAGELVEVDVVGVELGTVDAGELGLAADRHAAAAAHAGAVDHEGVQGDGRGDPIGTREIGHGLHHGHRADSVDRLRPRAVRGVEQALERRRDEAGLAEGAVFGGQQQLAGDGAELVAQHDIRGAAPADDGDELVAGAGQRLGERVEHGGAGAAAHTDDLAHLGDVRGPAERSGDVLQGLAGGHGHDVLRAAPYGLDDQGDGAGRRIVVGDREGDALAVGSGAHDDELSGLAGAGYARRQDDHAVQAGSDLFVAEDFEHVDLGFDGRAVATGPSPADGSPRPVRAKTLCDSRRHVPSYRRFAVRAIGRVGARWPPEHARPTTFVSPGSQGYHRGV